MKFIFTSAFGGLYHGLAFHRFFTYTVYNAYD